jgi:serine/threonine protein kinase
VARLIQAGTFVGPGEERTARYLEERLPEPWVVIATKELVNPSGSTREVDFIVIGQRTVFVIEEKFWWGTITGSEHSWVLNASASYPSPISQVAPLARRLAGILKTGVASLRDIRAHFVLPRVILSAENVDVRVNDPRVSTHVLTLIGCEEELEGTDASTETGDDALGRSREDIIGLLSGLQDRPAVPRLVGAYEVTEDLGISHGVRTLRARHDDGSDRFLRLIERPSTLLADRLATEKNRLMREYDALRKLADLGRTPHVDPWFEWNDGQFWVIPVHMPAGRTLTADRLGGGPATTLLRPVLKDAFAALGQVHDAGVLHREITPDNVYLSQSNRVTLSGMLIARISGEQTIAEDTTVEDAAIPYSPPELRAGIDMATDRSDVFSLAASSIYWLTGVIPASSGAESFPAEELFDALGSLGATAITSAMSADMESRPSAEDVASAISLPTKSVADTAGTLEVGSVIDNQYRIVRILGKGATAITYLAYDLMADEHVVLKTIQNPELREKLARVEFLVLRTLQHPNLPRVIDIRAPSEAFHIKLEYIRGTSLKDLGHSHVGDTAFLVRLGTEVLAALEYLHSMGYVHRDLSPGNVLIPDEDNARIRVIDFGVASALDDAITTVGTPRYRAPEIDRGSGWTHLADLYSVGVILYEVLTGQLPYVTRDGVADKQRVETPTDHDRAQFGGRLLDVLLRGCAPDPSSRFKSAAIFAKALIQATVETPPAPGLIRINPTVAALRRAYKNSLIGNADNRGLDTPFAEDTYLETRLDREVLPQILAKKFSLVILSGNPGDGKTAFLQRLAATLELALSVKRSGSSAGWRIESDSHVFEALYDASESHGDMSADVMLSHVLDPLAGESPGAPQYTGLIAVNDGRLIDFFERRGETHFPWLWSRIRAQLDGVEDQRDGILLIDLKQRSLVSAELTGSISDGILGQFVDEARWTICSDCEARNECPILFNARTFSDPSLSAVTRPALHELLSVVHLRRDRRPTIRDLRSALGYLITHDIDCTTVHSERSQGRSPAADADRLYFNAAFNGTGAPDLLLDEWVSLDPGAVPVPSLDRDVWFRRQRSTKVDGLLVDPTDRVYEPPLLGLELSPKDRVGQYKRRAYFEASAAHRDAGASARLPYQHLSAFREALQAVETTEIVPSLLRGLSRSDEVDLQPGDDRLAVRVSGTPDGEFVVVKLFGADEFALVRPSGHGQFVETLPDELVLQHTTGPSLSLTLDLFELLMRLRDGYTPGPTELGPLLEDLTVFKRQLLSRPSFEVLLLTGGEDSHRVTSRGGVLAREGHWQP